MRLRSSREASTASGARTEKPTSMSVNQSSALSPHAAHWSLVLRYLVRVGVRVRVGVGVGVRGWGRGRGRVRVRVSMEEGAAYQRSAAPASRGVGSLASHLVRVRVRVRVRGRVRGRGRGRVRVRARVRVSGQGQG